MLTIVTVTVKNDDTTIKLARPVYDAYHVDPRDPIIKSIIDEAVKQLVPNEAFSDTDLTIKVRITMDVQ